MKSEIITDVIATKATKPVKPVAGRTIKITSKQAKQGMVMMEILGPPISKRGRRSRWR